MALQEALLSGVGSVRQRNQSISALRKSVHPRLSRVFDIGRQWQWGPQEKGRTQRQRVMRLPPCARDEGIEVLEAVRGGVVRMQREHDPRRW